MLETQTRYTVIHKTLMLYDIFRLIRTFSGTYITKVQTNVSTYGTRQFFVSDVS